MLCSVRGLRGSLVSWAAPCCMIERHQYQLLSCTILTASLHLMTRFLSTPSKENQVCRERTLCLRSIHRQCRQVKVLLCSVRRNTLVRTTTPTSASTLHQLDLHTRLLRFKDSLNLGQVSTRLESK